MSFSLHGVGVSRGIAIGKVHIIERAELDIVEYSISDEAVPREILRLREAVSQAKLDLRAVRNQIPVKTAVDIAAFIDTHLLMLQDSTFTVDTERIIKERRCNA
ncbi:MAG: phosphotransferase system enzyme I (PtsI), partial [Gammaproteobacteria bacterium]